MGTWDHGLLDNDCANDGLAEVANGVAADIEHIGASKPSLTSTARLGAAVGVLLQLAGHHFADGRGGPLVAALQAHAASIARFPPPFRRALQRVIAGEGEALAGRPWRMSVRQAGLLHVGRREPPFGKREPALFAARPAAAYVQEVARRCVEMVDEDLEDESIWSDLCRESVGMGGLAALMVLEPCRVSPRKLAGWRRKAQAGLAALAAEPDEELPFHRAYYQNLDRVFMVLLARFAAA